EYWSTDELDIAFTSNASISFDYEAFLLEHRFHNSSWTTSIEEEGVEYTIYDNQSAELGVHTYVGTQGDYQHFNVTIRFPNDWENVTVEDPFLNDVTNECIITQNNLTIPTFLLESLGWWEVTFQSPNYAKSISSQKYVDSSEWITADLFRPGNITRTSVELGTESETPVIADLVNLTWYLPNGSIWWNESISSGIAGSLNSSSITFGATNTTAGEWYIEMEWMNGTEIAYASSSFSLYHIASLTPEYSIVNGDVGQTITNALRFQNGYTGEYLMSDDATLVGNWSGDSVQFAPNVVKNWWEGDFDTSLSGGGNFTVLVQASKPFYDEVNCTFHIVATYTTQMETDAPSDVPTEIGLNEVYTLNVSYQLSNDTGIEGATISVNYTGPTDGLDIDSPVPQSAGEYQVTMTGKKSGTYVVTVETSKSFHDPQSDSFTLIVEETGTTLTLINGTSCFVRYGNDYRYVVQYKNSSGDGLEGANISIENVEPSSGLEYASTNYVGEGLYSILLTPTDTTTFTILIKATKANHETQYSTFTLTVTEVPTSLTLNATSVTISVQEQFVLGLVFEDETGTPIPGATIVAQNTPAELDFSPVTDYGDGNYSLVIDPLYVGSYLLSFSASKDNYLSGYESFSLNVDEIGTALIHQNGTADSIRFGGEYNLVVRYVNSSGYGLLGAGVTVSSVLPESGLEYGTTQEIGDGYYGLLLTPDSADTYTIVVKANLTNHETQFTTFSLTVSEIPTSLTSIPSSSTIAFDLNETVKLIFEDENQNRLEGATITVLNIPEGLEVSGISEQGNGTYEVVLNPSEVGSYSILLRASLENYQNSTVGFSLLVKEIPTELLFLESDGSASVSFSDPFTIEMIYARTDLNQNVTEANINITLSQPDGPAFTLTSVGEIYRIMFDTEYIGSWIINIKATRENYEPKTREFKLTIQKIQTVITDITLQDDFLYDHTYTLDYDYLVSSNRTGINGADVSVSGIDDDWVEIFSPGDGLYRINLTPTSLGTYSAVFSFSKMGCASQTSSLEFHVDEVPVGISLLDELTDIAQEEKTLRIRFYERETDIPVSDATVTYVIFGSERGLWREGTFTEEEDGIYSATFTMPPADNQDYHIKIRMDKPNYVLEEDSGVYPISPYLSDEAFMGRFVTTYMLPFSVIGAGLVIAYGTYILYRRKKHERTVQQNRIKRVFTDAQNLLGVLILNTESGIPLYSRIIREELDDTVISAFISAITQFKSEFDLASPYEEWEVTPISDLIRIVATKDLICAFIVVREPSETQKEKMKLFAQKVDSIWSEVYQTTPSEVLDSTTKREFDKLFDDVLDASLLKTHEVVDESQLPEELRDLEDKIEGIDEDSLDLTKLAQSLVARGLEEREAYTLIMDALKKRAIAETDETAPDRL
ncbi:MAG: carboxypeptidase-like regulatory domain-containing protein, partial [Candidatus Thorarchaeota archaeon]